MLELYLTISCMRFVALLFCSFAQRLTLPRIDHCIPCGIPSQLSFTASWAFTSLHPALLQSVSPLSARLCFTHLWFWTLGTGPGTQQMLSNKLNVLPTTFSFSLLRKKKQTQNQKHQVLWSVILIFFRQVGGTSISLNVLVSLYVAGLKHQTVYSTYKVSGMLTFPLQKLKRSAGHMFPGADSDCFASMRVNHMQIPRWMSLEIRCIVWWLYLITGS